MCQFVPFDFPSDEQLYLETLQKASNLNLRACTVERAMVALEKSFRQEFPRTNLRLQAKRPTKKSREYALYWVKLRHHRGDHSPFRKAGSPDPITWHQGKTWTKHYGNLSNYLIKYSGGNLYAHRRRIRQYDRDRKRLNEMHKALCRARNAIKSMLDYGYVRKYPKHLLSSLPLDPFGEFVMLDLGSAIVNGARLFSLAVVEAREALREFVADYRANPPCRAVRPVFFRDRQHPNGRIKWSVLGMKTDFSSLTNKVKRRIGIVRSAFKELTAWEKKRRQLARDYKKHTNVLNRIRRWIRDAVGMEERRWKKLEIVPGLREYGEERISG